MGSSQKNMSGKLIPQAMKLLMISFKESIGKIAGRHEPSAPGTGKEGKTGASRAFFPSLSVSLFNKRLPFVAISSFLLHWKTRRSILYLAESLEAAMQKYGYFGNIIDNGNKRAVHAILFQTFASKTPSIYEKDDSTDTSHCGRVK